MITKSSEIDRLVAINSPNVKELIDISVRKVMETDRLLERYHDYLNNGAVDSKHARLLENFNRARNKLEKSVERYGQSRAAPPSTSSGTQLRVMNTDPLRTSSSVRQPLAQVPSSYDYISSMEEGNQTRTTLHDLTRVHKEMSNLQDIYYTLSETAQSQQHTLLDSVSSNLSKASEKVTETVKELNRAQERLDYWTRIKLYAVTGVAAVGLVIWLV